MECKECTELLFDYYDDAFDANLKIQVDEHLGRCHSCRNELATISSTMNFFKENMPIMEVDHCFVEQVMYKIDLEETTTALIKPMEGITIVLAMITFGMLIMVGPTIISLLMLVGNILLGLLSTAAVVFAAFPLLQISSSIILGILLLLVTVFMRKMVFHNAT